MFSGNAAPRKIERKQKPECIMRRPRSSYEHQILNDNVTEWLLGTVEIPDDEIFAKSRCALMYTLFEHDLTEPVEQRPRPETFNSLRHFIGKSA